MLTLGYILMGLWVLALLTGEGWYREGREVLATLLVMVLPVLAVGSMLLAL